MRSARSSRLHRAMGTLDHGRGGRRLRPDRPVGRDRIGDVVAAPELGEALKPQSIGPNQYGRDIE